MTNTTIEYLSRIGARDRKCCLVVCSADGRVAKFSGKDMPEFDLRIYRKESEKAGKWSNTRYFLSTTDGTTSVLMRQTFEEGVYWPQGSWETALRYFRNNGGSQVLPTEFEALVRQEWPDAAAKFDAHASSEANQQVAERRVYTCLFQPFDLDWERATLPPDAEAIQAISVLSKADADRLIEAIFPPGSGLRLLEASYQNFGTQLDWVPTGEYWLDETEKGAV